MHHPTDRIIHTMAFDTPDVEHALKSWGGGGGAQSNFPTCDHQNTFNLIITYILFFLGGLGATAMRGREKWKEQTLLN